MWRGHKQRNSFNAIRNSVILAQATAKGSDGFMLSPAWRSSLEQIKSIEGREYAQDFCHRTRFPNFTIQLKPEQDALE
jgi:hypothetical protein